MNKILVICAHPDDECLGLAGTLRKHVWTGDEVYCLILGEGAVCRELEGGNLISQSQQAGKIIGFKEMYFEFYPDNKMDTIPLLDICQTVEKYIKKTKPDIVYTHHGGDLNIDHRITFQAVMTSCRPGLTSVKEIYCFETPSSTEWTFDGSFKPNVFVDVMNTLGAKLKAMECYSTEIKGWPHPRSLRALRARAEYWGQTAGIERAEPFELIRKII